MSDLRVLFGKGPGENLPETLEDGKLYVTEDTGKAYLDTSGNRRVEIRSDLPFGILYSNSNQVSAEVLVSLLSAGFSLRVYGSRIPQTLNVNDTGDTPVYVKGALVEEDVLFDSDRLLTYTLLQSSDGEWRWNVNDIESTPVIRDIAGTTNLDRAITSGHYIYIGDTGVICQLQVSTCAFEYEGVPTTTVTQLLLKPRMNPEEDLDNLGHGLKLYGLFTRSGYQMGEEFVWEGDFEKVSTNIDLPAKPDSYLELGKHEYYMLCRHNQDGDDRLYWQYAGVVPPSRDSEKDKILVYDPSDRLLCRWGNLFTEHPNLPRTDAENTFSQDQTVLGNINITGNINISGNIYQGSSSYETHAEQVYTKNDYIILREGAESGLAPVVPGDANQTGQFAGFEAKNYDGTTDGRLVFDNTGTARVGDKGGEQPLATRAEASSIPDGTLLRWDAQNLRLVSTGLKINAELTKSQYDALTNKDPNTLYLLREG